MYRRKRVTEITADREYLVVCKGTRGFHKTKKICKDTTILDLRIDRTRSLYNLAYSLCVENKPMQFSSSGKYERRKSKGLVRNTAIPQITAIFKYAELFEIREEDDDTIIECIVVDNDKNRYKLEVSESYTVARLQLLEVVTKEVKDIPEEHKPHMRIVHKQVIPETTDVPAAQYYAKASNFI
jgi:hypothetical protein